MCRAVPSPVSSSSHPSFPPVRTWRCLFYNFLDRLSRLLTLFFLFSCVACSESGLRPCKIRGFCCVGTFSPSGNKTTPNRLRYPTGFVMVFSLSRRSLTRHGSSPTGSPLEEAHFVRKETAWVPVFYPPLIKKVRGEWIKKLGTPKKRARF